MKLLCVLILFGGSFFGLAVQDNIGTPFYLVDSLNLSELNSREKGILDSILTVYHESDSEVTQLYLLTDLIDAVESKGVKLVYNEYVQQKAERLYFSSNKSNVERDEIGGVIALTYSNQAAILRREGALLKALDYANLSLKIAKNVGATKMMIVANNSMGSIYQGLGDLDTALYFYKSGYAILDTFDYPEKEVFILNNLAVLYSVKNEELKALEYLNRVLEISIALDDQYVKGIALSNIGALYSILDSNVVALKYFDEALQIFSELENERWQALTNRELAEIYMESGELEKARMVGDEAWEYASSVNQMIPLLEVSSVMKDIYKRLGNYEKALYFKEVHTELNDSLTNQNIIQLNKQKKMADNYNRLKLIGEKENEKKMKIAEIDRRTQIVVSVFIGGLLFIFVVFSIFTYKRLKTITAQKVIIEEQNEERKILLQEIHHRVKNNFQIVCSILKLQAAEEESKFIDRAFEDAINRILSMSTVHELIYRQENFGAINPRYYLLKLTDSLSSYSKEKEVQFDVDSNVKELSLESLIPLGISINELITNSLKYAFNNSSELPLIRIRLKTEGNEKVLFYQDNGVGTAVESNVESFGMDLIHTVVDQIDGRFEKFNDENWNTSYKIFFK